MNSEGDANGDILSMRDELHEVKEMLTVLLAKQGIEWTDRPNSNLFAGREERIPLESAVPMIWSKSAAKDSESLRNHTEILKIWCTKGLNSAILETEVDGGEWFTSRLAVVRFQQKLGLASENVSTRT
ncbi:MAG: hypothetical protein DWQ31_18345 [Planctomycetota bacterium]|nr:MAG: hypothetical protein DWQ31_18345 [Planctomycetota bacterium]REJ87325.1 MAG: hypothetical protein DWQ35_21685 [Planctomycetota bacterium]REK22662.1 MAG: hypothetical protein DWQ42_16560 [Planctomycetota bacterium]REK42505.1 MAG: hypothetical protein DWQ46_13030 [Planctomycetota bacterium]